MNADTAHWKIVYETNPTFLNLYPTFEDFMMALARHVMKKAKECGAWEKASPEMKKKAERLGVF